MNTTTELAARRPTHRARSPDMSAGRPGRTSRPGTARCSRCRGTRARTCTCPSWGRMTSCSCSGTRPYTPARTAPPGTGSRSAHLARDTERRVRFRPGHFRQAPMSNVQLNTTAKVKIELTANSSLIEWLLKYFMFNLLQSASSL